MQLIYLVILVVVVVFVGSFLNGKIRGNDKFRF